MMMELQLQGEDGVNVKKEEEAKCAKYIEETVRNMDLHFIDKSKTIKCSSRIINLSLTLFLRNKSS